MLVVRWSRTVVASVSALALVFACSSKMEDGAACERNADCESGQCSAGSCEGSDCTCKSADCRMRGSCLEGWLCTRGAAVTEDAIPRCRKECAAAGTCPSDKHCDNGVCKAGAETFVLSWVNLPRTTPCGARVPCKYEVRSSGNTAIDTYTWTFGDAAQVDTKEAATTFTYAKRGTYTVVVRARATTGADATLRTTEVVCEGAVGDPCDVGVGLCCEGSCVAGKCK